MIFIYLFIFFFGGGERIPILFRERKTSSTALSSQMDSPHTTQAYAPNSKSGHIPLSSTNLIIQSVKVKSVKHSLRRDFAHGFHKILIHKDHNFLIFLLSTHKMKISRGGKKKVIQSSTKTNITPRANPSGNPPELHERL